MKVLFDLGTPFAYAHGGFQVQIEQTRYALERAGLEVEWLRRWDADQTGDLVHAFGVTPVGHQNLARNLGMPLLQTVLLSETCNRPMSKLRLQRAATRLLIGLPIGRGIKNQLMWQSFRNSDCTIVGLEAERMVLQMVYGVDADRIGRVPLGCETLFLKAAPSTREGDFLICSGTIGAQKQSVALAQMAIAAKAPILFIGKPYSEADPHWQEFCHLAHSSPYVRHQPHLADRREMLALMQQARGFVIFSQYENWCLAADEAAACGLPLLLPDQRWARERFGERAHYLRHGETARNVAALNAFYTESPRLPAPPRPLSWDEAVLPLIEIYRHQLAAKGRRPQAAPRTSR